ncbi:DUF4274 domain-containing protein [Lysinibacillus fusiformis]|uniref:DUF4274 domain-containing protein n=1 Tax=Lysinibacillus fusiformis TaxID=28031 RepID=UPI001F4D5D32|nr:DUF4274 domain-containing protein [Lysinibacillus fusiformis]MCK1989113.1 DUF4274 domain-containing protein [Lysinibacillus fusiformis]
MEWAEVSQSKNLETVREAVSKLDVNECDARGRTPLMLFITNRMSMEGIELLLAQNIDLEVRDKLGDTALKKAVKFKQKEVISLLLARGVSLQATEGMTATAWYNARAQSEIADLLLDTPGAIRLTLNSEEQRQVDTILNEENLDKMCQQISKVSSSIILHAIVNHYNWDDGPEPMIAALNNPVCAVITFMDMFELMEGDYWLAQAEVELDGLPWKQQWREMAENLKVKLEL